MGGTCSLVERQYVSQRDSGRYMQPRGEAVCKSEPCESVVEGWYLTVPRIIHVSLMIVEI